MNRFYCHIWSRPLGQVVAIPECARGGAGRKSAMRHGTSLIALALILAAVSGSGAIADTTWTNAGGDNDWNNPANWSNGLPADNAGQTTRVVGDAPAVVDGIAVVDSGRTNVGAGTGDGTLMVQGGGTLNAGTFELFGTNGFSGTATVTGAGSSVSSSSLFVGAYSGVGHLFVEDGGSLISGFHNYLSQYDGSLGTVTVTGTGSIFGTTSSQINIGGAEGNYDATGILTIADGGLVVAGGGTGVLRVGHSNGSTGIMNIGAAEGEVAVAAGTVQVGGVVFGAGDASLIFNHTDPGYIFSTPISGNGEVRQLAGTTILTGANTYSGTTVVEGGTLRAGQASAFSSNAAYEVNGGILDFNDFSRTIAALSGTGGTVDLGSAELTIDQDDDTSFSGAITGSGSLVKLGQGVLALLGISTYSGSTEVVEGTLEVSGGGTLAGASGAIGGGLGEAGKVTVSGVGSEWNIVGELYIGDAGAGTLDILDGGVVSSTNGYIANQAGSSGDVTVDGAGSEWNLSGNLAVGNSGDATLAISGGGAVANVNSYVGYFVAGSSAVTVDGADSFWDNSGELNLGVWGGATLEITSGGAVSNASGHIGRHATGDGEVTVSGANSIWTSSGWLYIGDGGTGELTVENGGAVENVIGLIGSTADATGTVTVRDAGSTWTSSDNMAVGYFGDGTLAVESGGAVFNVQGFVGDQSTATGFATVTGAGSAWTNSGLFAVGNFGEGTLEILDGGSVSNTTGHIGRIADGSGEVTVDGEDSIWSNSGELRVGEAGSGTLEISGGGAVTNTTGVIGYTATGSGAVTVSGANSIWTNSGALTVGRAATGSVGNPGAALSIVNGGAVSNTAGTIGNQADSTGEVTVDGTDSVWINSGDLVVGATGNGTLAISNGGAVSNASGFIGDLAAGTGSVTVDGAGSTWTNTGGNGLNVGWMGSATLDISGGGAVSSQTGYIGRQAGSDGAAAVSGADSIWTNSGDLYIGLSGAGTLTLSGGGTVEAASVIIANNASSTGTLNIGAASGDAAAGAGTLDAVSVAFGSGAGTLVFNHTGNDYLFGASISGTGEVLVESGETILTAATTHTGGTTISGGTLQLGNGGTTGSLAGDVANDGTFAIGRSNAYTYAGAMSGSGDFRQLGAGTTTLTGDSSGFAGATFVEAGMLIVKGILGGAMNVTNALLGGSGAVGSIALGAGATVAPGNSVGTLNVAGDFAFNAGSIYEVELNDGGNTPGVNNDFIDIAGALTIDIGASVWVTPENATDDGSTYTPGLLYTILSATGGVTGTFGSADSSFAFLTPELSYDANNVFLELVQNDVGFADVGKTPNQKGVGNTVQQFGPGHPLYDEIIMMTDEEARAAYDALSGEAHASASASQFMTAGEIRQQLLSRIAALLGSGGGGLASLAGVPAAGDAAPGTASIWGQLFGGWGENDAGANAAAIDRRIHGFIGGADREVAPGINAGFALGYSRTSYDVAARASSGDSDNFHIAGYAGVTLGDVNLKGILAYGYGRAETQRTVIAGGVTNNLSASYGTHTVQAAVEAAIDFDAGPVTLTPFAGLAGVHVKTESFTETGGPAALTFDSTGNTTGISTLGLRVSREAGQVELSGAAAWRHAFGDVEPASRAAFASAPASTFAVRGAPVSADALMLDAGVTARLDTSTTLTLGYSGEYASGARDHGLRAELRIEF